MRFLANNLIIGMLLVSVAGCHYGPQIEDMDTARRPEGAEVTVYLSGGGSTGSPPRGELLEVRRESVLVNVRGEPDKGFGSSRMVTQIDYEHIDHIDAGDFGSLHLGSNTAEADRDRLRLVSRFPQGLDPELLDELLKAQGQGSLIILGQ